MSIKFIGNMEYIGDLPSGTPEWLPEGATLFMDFENAHYWDGTEVALNDMISPLEHGDYILSGGRFTPSSSGAISLDGNALAIVTDSDGITVIVEGEFVADWDEAFRLNDGLSHVIAAFIDGADTTGVYVEETGTNEFVSVQSDVSYGGDPAPLKFAITLTSTKMALSDRGGAVVSAVLTPATHWFVWDTFTLRGMGSKFKTVTVYPPQDDADLPALSAL